MKRKILWLIPVIILFVSCRGGENKADSSSPELPAKTDTVATPATTTAPAAPVDSNSSAGQARGLKITAAGDILSNIDKHLVTTIQLKPVAAGGFTDCIVTVTNTLADASFQKALVEVSVIRDDSFVIKKDYYTVINIEPGMSKVIKVPNFNMGASVIATVVKVKSLELTNGEFVLAGPK